MALGADQTLYRTSAEAMALGADRTLCVQTESTMLAIGEQELRGLATGR